jgi:hypothetical protein
MAGQGGQKSRKPLENIYFLCDTAGKSPLAMDSGAVLNGR